MDLSKTRRIAILVVGFLLTINLILLGLAWSGARQAAAGPSEYQAVAWVEKAEGAEALKTALEGAGLVVTVKETSRDVKVPSGFKLVMRGDVDLLKSVEATLKFKKRQVKLVEDEGSTELQLGGTFPDKAKAESKAKEVAKVDKVNFQVVEAFKSVKKQVQEIRIASIPAEKLAEVEGMLEGKTLDHEVNPVAGAGEASPEGQTSPAAEGQASPAAE